MIVVVYGELGAFDYPMNGSCLDTNDAILTSDNGHEMWIRTEGNAVENDSLLVFTHKGGLLRTRISLH